MNKKTGKWLLAVVAMCCLTPAMFAHDSGHRGHKPPPCEHNCGPTAVPEGGSTAVYLLGAGLTCFGAMFLRSRIAKPAQS